MAAAASSQPLRSVPDAIRKLPLNERVRWARTSAGLSHDRLVAALGRSNRGHLIKIEKGIHAPGADLRDAIADATRVPRDLFAEDDDGEADPAVVLLNVLRQLVRDEIRGVAA
jgi:transcriptional regulator with XRE-family HTH domain